MVIKPNSSTSNTQVNVVEREIIALILEFLETRNLNIAQVTLERETGVVNGVYSEEVLFLRNLIFDGLWDDAVEYVEPLAESPDFDYTAFKKSIYKFKFLELLCIKCEVGNVKFSDTAAIVCLKDLESVCARNELNEFRLLLSYPRIQDHPEYGDWNPSSARVRCFREVRPLVDEVLRLELSEKAASCIHTPENRLIHLLIKGILYESAGRLCAQRAKKQSDDLRFTSLLPRSSPNPDMTLLSWLQALPYESFAWKFEERNLPLNYQRFEKPQLEASWTDLIQSSPIRTKKNGAFPAASMSARATVEDRMVQSMIEQMDGFRRRSFGAGAQSARNKMMSQSFHLGGLGQEDPVVSELFSDALKSTPNSSRTPRARNEPLAEEPQSAKTPVVSSDFRQNYGEPLSPLHENVSLETDGYETPKSLPSANMEVSRDDRMQSEKERKRLQNEWEEREKQRELLLAQILNTPGVPGSPHVPGESSNETDSDPTTPMKPQKTTLISPLKYSNIATPAPDWTHCRIAAGDSPVVQYRMESVSPPSTKTSALRSADRTAGDKTEYFSPVSSSSRRLRNPDHSETNGGSPEPSYVNQEATRQASLLPETSEDAAPFCGLQVVNDDMIIRCAAFHPSGDFYAVGSNSRTLRVCQVPTRYESRKQGPCPPAMVMDSRTLYHKGALFCLAWSPDGKLLASGSNDKIIKICSFNADGGKIEDFRNLDLRIHQDTVRDITFLDDPSSSNLMLSGGADSVIGMTDCSTATCFKKLTDHTATVLSICSWSGPLFCSGSMDKTCRLWDCRSKSCTNIIGPHTGLPAYEVTCVRVDKSGKVLFVSHENGQCSLWDLRGEKVLQTWQPHSKEIRGIALTSRSNALLTCSYDKSVVMHALEGNLCNPLPSFTAAYHDDKVIQCHFSPKESAYMTFLTTSSDKSCVLWAPATQIHDEKL